MREAMVRWCQIPHLNYLLNYNSNLQGSSDAPANAMNSTTKNTHPPTTTTTTTTYATNYYDKVEVELVESPPPPPPPLLLISSSSSKPNCCSRIFNKRSAAGGGGPSLISPQSVRRGRRCGGCFASILLDKDVVEDTTTTTIVTGTGMKNKINAAAPASSSCSTTRAEVAPSLDLDSENNNNNNTTPSIHTNSDSSSYDINNNSNNSSSSSSSSSSEAVAVAVAVDGGQKKKNKKKHEEGPILISAQLLLRHPLALLAFVPKDMALFTAGAIAGAAAKTLTAPLDRIKLLMQTHGLCNIAEEHCSNNVIGFFQAIEMIWKEEGAKGYWKGNLPQVIRIIPYSAVQLFSYEAYKKLFKGQDRELSLLGRLAAGACAGMTSTLVTYPLDVLRLRLAVEPGCKKMTQVALAMLKDEGIASFYSGLGPSLIGIAPYIAVNFCVFDLVKKSLPEEFQKRPESSLVTALLSATLATLTCYPLDTVRRQMQMKGSPYKTVLDAFPGIISRDGFIGLYRGFVPNALKNLPNSSIRLTTFDTVKGLIGASKEELQRLIEENRVKVVE